MGKRHEALEHLTTATTMYREMDMGFWLEKAETEIGWSRAMTRVLAMAMLIVAVLFAPLVAETQPAENVYRIGWLHPVTMPPTWMEAMRQGLRHHGYIEGEESRG
jgi:hypothetical protein